MLHAAKKRKSRAVNSESGLYVTDEASRNASGRVSDDKQQYSNGEAEQLVSPQENDLTEKAASSSSAVCSSEENERRDQIENSECNGEKPITAEENILRGKASFSSSGECSSEGNIERGQIENAESNEEQQFTSQENGLSEKRTSSSSGECSFDGNGERGQIENGECNEERPVISQENDLREKATSSSGNCSLDENGGRGQIENGECNEEQLGPLNLSDEEPKNTIDIYKLSDIRHTVSNKGCSNDELSHCDIEASAESTADNSGENANKTNLKLENEELSNGNMPLEGEGNQLISSLDREDSMDEKSALVGVKSQVDIGGNASTAERLNTENLASERGSISEDSPHELKEGIYDNHASSPQNIHHSFDHLRSALDTFHNAEVNNLSLEISGALDELSKSPTTRSSHAYDGSVSSNDAMDERFLGQKIYSFEGGSGKGKDVNRLLYEDVETQHQSNFPDRKYRVMNRNDVPETSRHDDHAHCMRTKKVEFPFKMPFHGSGSQSGYESGSPSNQMFDEVYCSSSYVSPDSIEDPDQEKMKLLRMVYKLQDQLNRTRHANREGIERTAMENHISAYQKSHDFHEGRFYHGSDYPRGDTSYIHGINWHQRHNFLFSAEPTGNSHHVDHPYFNCFPQERQFSREFPPHFPYQREDLCRPHPGHSRCLSHQSYPSSSSPQWLMTSELVHGRETKSCDQRHRSFETNYTRDNPSLTKRHYRPVAGGAPFITCHKCLKLLQLPANFLLFKRVCHRLKCGSCQEVLKFSLQNRTHIVSYTPRAVGPSSSDFDLRNKLTNGMNPHAESHAVDPVSYSDDYGRSISKSYSSEGDHVSVAPVHHSRSGARDNPNVSPSTFEAITEREAPESPPKSSALHQLMGYSSPSQVIRGAPIPSSVEGKETMLNGEH